MSVPGWWEALLLALAAFRLWKLLADDAILDRWRDRIMDGHEKLEEFVLCPWCLGFWITLAGWAAWQAWPHATLVAATPFALSGAVGLIATHRNPS